MIFLEYVLVVSVSFMSLHPGTSFIKSFATKACTLQLSNLHNSENRKSIANAF